MKKAHFSVLKIVRYHFFYYFLNKLSLKKISSSLTNQFFFFATKISKKFKILS